MKTIPRLGLALLLSGGTAVLVAAATASSISPAEKTHVLYMGLDLSVMQEKKFHRVENVEGSEFVIRVAGENRFVRTRLQRNELKLDPELKLSPLSVRLDDLQGGPGYTPANDPNLKFDARSGAAGGAQAANDISTAAAAEITQTIEVIRANGDALGRLPGLEHELERQNGFAQSSGSQMSSDYSSIGHRANERELELAEGNFDLVDISFRISSPVPLDRPYLVAVVEFQSRDAKPGETSTLVHAKALDPLDATPRYVRIREGGLPIGFKFLRYEVHVYNRGREVATNASPKRVELTRDEARQYLLLEYLGEHKDATVPASAVPASLPATVRTSLQPGQLQRVVYVQVAKDGSPLGVFADEACRHPLDDPELVSALAGAFFKPALAKGKPVDGVARLRLADLTL
jgi:hypothetical protein